MDENRRNSPTEARNRVSARVGQQIGNYRLLHVLEQQADHQALARPFASSYLGEHIQSKAQVVVDIFHPALTGDLKSSFLQQTYRLSQLVHPHILHIREAGTTEDYMPYLVFDYASHTTLQQLYPKGTTQPLAHIFPHIQQIASALQYTHDQGILHQQLQPSSILQAQNKEILVCDFAIDALTQNKQRHSLGQVIENVAYSAPEQLRNKPCPASDQYSLAIAIYEWLSGDLPFRGTPVEIMRRHSHVPPPSLRQKVPMISPAIEEVIFTALAKEPTKRFASISAFVNALEQAQKPAQRPVARPITPIPPSVPSTGAVPAMPAHIPPPPQPTSFQPMLQQASAQHPSVPAPAMQQWSGQYPSVPASSVPAQPAPAMQQWSGRYPAAPAPIPPAQPAPAMQQWSGQYPAAPAAMPAQTPPAMQHASGQYPATPAPIPAQSAPAVGKLMARPKVKPEATMTRRVFAMGFTALALAAGTGGWLALSHQFAHSAVPSQNINDTKNTISTPKPGSSSVLTYRAHPARVSSVAWSPDNTLIASASDDKLVLICNSSSGSTRLAYRRHTAAVYAVAWSPDGKLIASAGADKTVQIWDATTGNILFTYTGHTDAVNAVAWSSDSTLVASGSDDQSVQVWKALSGDIAMRYFQHSAGVLSVAWSPDNKIVASGSWDNSLQGFSTVNTQAFNIGDTVFNYGGHNKEVYAVAWSPDGTLIASASADQTVQLCDGVNGATKGTYKGHTDVVRALTWSPDSTQIASAGSDSTVQQWTVGTRQTIFTYHGHTNPVFATAWSFDGAHIASAGSDNTMQVWQPTNA